MACLRMASILPDASGAHLVGRHDCNGSYPPTPPCTLSLVIKQRNEDFTMTLVVLIDFVLVMCVQCTRVQLWGSKQMGLQVNTMKSYCTIVFVVFHGNKKHDMKYTHIHKVNK